MNINFKKKLKKKCDSNRATRRQFTYYLQKQMRNNIDHVKLSKTHTRRPKTKYIYTKLHRWNLERYNKMILIV